MRKILIVSPSAPSEFLSEKGIEAFQLLHELQRGTVFPYMQMRCETRWMEDKPPSILPLRSPRLDIDAAMLGAPLSVVFDLRPLRKRGSNVRLYPQDAIVTFLLEFNLGSSVYALSDEALVAEIASRRPNAGKRVFAFAESLQAKLECLFSEAESSAEMAET